MSSSTYTLQKDIRFHQPYYTTIQSRKVLCIEARQVSNQEHDLYTSAVTRKAFISHQPNRRNQMLEAPWRIGNDVLQREKVCKLLLSPLCTSLHQAWARMTAVSNNHWRNWRKQNMHSAALLPIGYIHNEPMPLETFVSLKVTILGHSTCWF